MSDIFGFSLAGNQALTSAGLQAMSSALMVKHPLETPVLAVSGLAALGSTQAKDFACNQDDILVCIVGNPHWSNRHQQQVAKEKGIAHSVAKAFRKYGVGLLEHLRGPFSLAILIPAENRTLLAVDRLGIHSLSWTRHQENVVFSSDAKVLRAFPGIESEIDQQALFNYFYFHMVPSPGTIYRGIEKLLPGQYVDINDSHTERNFYWSLHYEESKLSETELAEQLKERLQNAVQKCAPRNAATGTFLSGGLDSSTVAGYFARIANGTADAYGIGFDAEGYDEMEYARAAARHFGVKLHEYYVTPEDVTEAIPRVAAAYDEPFGNASAIPAYFCARLAREDGKTSLLAGDGGDEIFAGNEHYAKQLIFALYSRIPAMVRHALIEPVTEHFPLRDRLPPIRKLFSYITQAKIPMPERMESYNFLHRTDPDEIFESSFLESIDTHYPIENQQDVYDRANTPEMLKKMLHLDLKITLADNDLRKVSRMCQLAGIDVHYPMLDEALVEFSAKVPSNLLLRGNRLRDFYKNALKDFLPPETLSKRKHGFGLPSGVWMAQDKRLRELADDSLVGLRSRGFIQPAYIDQLLEAHRSEHAGYYGVMIWVMMMLEQWFAAHDY